MSNIESSESIWKPVNPPKGGWKLKWYQRIWNWIKR